MNGKFDNIHLLNLPLETYQKYKANLFESIYRDLNKKTLIIRDCNYIYAEQEIIDLVSKGILRFCNLLVSGSGSTSWYYYRPNDNSHILIFEKPIFNNITGRYITNYSWKPLDIILKQGSTIENYLNLLNLK